MRVDKRVTGAVLVLLAVAGCGGSSTPKLTKAEFVVKANKICALGNAKLRRVEAGLGAQPSSEQISSFATNTYIPSIQDQINEVRALGTVESEEATITHMLDVAQEELDKVKAEPELLAKQPPPFSGFASIAHPYGLTLCAPGS